MATTQTHDLRYEDQDKKSSLWSWLLPLALLVIGVIALMALLNNDADTINTGNLGGNNTPASGFEQSSGVQTQ